MEPIHPGMSAASVAQTLASLFDTLVIEYAVILIDTERRIAAWNRGATHVLGYEPGDMLGQPIDIIFTPEDRERQAPQQEAAVALAVGRACDDRWHLRKDGSRFWVSGVLTALRDETGRPCGFAKIMRDRTDLRTQIETLKNRIDSEAGERERNSILLGTLAHELRNPLAPLSNAAHLIRRTVDDGRLQYPLQIIDRQIAFLQRLIDDLLDVTRAGAGKLRLSYSRFVLQDALSEAVDNVQQAARAQQQRVEAVLPSTPIEIEADRDRFMQIVINLLNNAVRYTPAQGRVWLKGSVEARHAVVRVEDTGQGITPELQPRIFDLFTQGDVPSGARNTGLGIGLSLVKELVAAHGGTVAVRSEGVGKGSEFTVRLPLAAPASQRDA